MEIIQTNIPDVLLIKPQVFGDERGFFMETFRQTIFDELGFQFVQDNHSKSTKGVLRGLHYQIQQPQGKLVRVTKGEVFDVAVDMRKASPTFGKSVCVRLSEENKHVFWVPPGFAHGFLVVSDEAEFVYKCTDYYAPEFERSLLWNDPALEIHWPLDESGEPTLSEKDIDGKLLKDAEVYL
ncbi:MAG: dTDP-4-dehydrorhamnose 3,5-epimerase [Cellvibrionaceae bacterium]